MLGEYFLKEEGQTRFAPIEYVEFSVMLLYGSLSCLIGFKMPHAGGFKQNIQTFTFTLKHFLVGTLVIELTRLS